jgi:hypothetical protein
MHVAIDSMALTYLLEAMEPTYDPTTDDPTLASERLAMIRTYLYAEQYLYVLPQVKIEYRRIRNTDWRNSHESLVGALLMEINCDLDSSAVVIRKEALLAHHSKESDCQVTAEAEVAMMDILLTFDKDFVRKLSAVSKICITLPSLFWKELDITPRTKPRLSPSRTNPLSTKNWWKV